MKLSTVCFALLVTSSNAWLPLTPLKSTRIHSSAVEESAAAATESALLPEFEAALKQAKGALNAAIPEEQTEKLGKVMVPLLEHFMDEYLAAGQAAFLAGDKERCAPAAVAGRILTGIQYGMKFGMGEDKYKFDVTHTALRGDPEKEDGNTVDFYKFGCDFFGPCMDLDKSRVLGIDNLQQAMDQIAAGENVVLLANHQSEADPQALSVLMEKAGFEKQAAEMIYIAGHKVTTDTLAIPFSMGRNLVCIHSKKHMDSEPDLKKMKQRQNLQAMSAMLKKMKEGGALLWVAPSGGRDRRDVETGEVPIAPFDSKTIDMFRLMGNKSEVKTHYYSLAMVSYDLCPPPDHVEAGTGEQRNVRFGPVGISMGPELESTGGLESRREFCDEAMKQCQIGYDDLLANMKNN